MLDEPTNDLDLETLDVLEEMLGDYGGTVLLISHDRDFLDRVVNAVLVPEGNGGWAEYAGGYTDMLAQRGEDVAADSGEAGTRAPTKSRQRRPKTPRRGRLSFNEKYALETLPGEIAALQGKIRAAPGELADPTLYERDRKAFDAISRSSSRRKRSSPPPRTNGWSWRSCARRSAAERSPRGWARPQ